MAPCHDWSCFKRDHPATDSRPSSAALIVFLSPMATPGTISVSNRSEEHTSELQSQSNLVCRLLLEKKTTIHVPLIYRHPGHIRAGQRSNILVSNYDFLPTLLDYLGLAEMTPQKPRLPGHSYSDSLHGKHEAWDNTVFFEFENTRAIRTFDWKYINRFPDGPSELYDLKSDPGERHNLVDQPDHAAQQ